ncbi:MAG: hypothetical protein M0006_13945 [Magnetospirillum sp.]|nr:hypothetical protein [Magnetospirillum sp.]
MAEDVTLSAAVRVNQLSLRNAADLMARSGSRGGTAVDAGPVGGAASATDGVVTDVPASRIDSQAAVKQDIARGIGTLTQAMDATRSIQSLVGRLKDLVGGAGQNSYDSAEFSKQFNALRSQIDKVAGSASYQGINLVSGSAQSLTVTASADGTATVSLVSVNFTAAGLGIGEMPQDKAAQASSLQSAMSALDSALATVQGRAGQFSADVAQLQTALSGGTQGGLSDVNAEGANLLALQTRQQLGSQSLSFAGQAEQQVLGLFRS